jgi:hypothetical protein
MIIFSRAARHHPVPGRSQALGRFTASSQKRSPANPNPTSHRRASMIVAFDPARRRSTSASSDDTGELVRSRAAHPSSWGVHTRAPRPPEAPDPAPPDTTDPYLDTGKAS